MSLWAQALAILEGNERGPVGVMPPLRVERHKAFQNPNELFDTVALGGNTSAPRPQDRWPEVLVSVTISPKGTQPTLCGSRRGRPEQARRMRRRKHPSIVRRRHVRLLPRCKNLGYQGSQESASIAHASHVEGVRIPERGAESGPVFSCASSRTARATVVACPIELASANK